MAIMRHRQAQQLTVSCTCETGARHCGICILSGVNLRSRLPSQRNNSALATGPQTKCLRPQTCDSIQQMKSVRVMQV
jgi:hypothetical protein